MGRIPLARLMAFIAESLEPNSETDIFISGSVVISVALVNGNGGGTQAGS
jgi:hypothetical protein